MLAKIDAKREELGMPKVLWWPSETESVQKKETESAEKKETQPAEKKSTSAPLWILESDAEGGIVVELMGGGPTELGRGLVSNKKVSRKQCVVDATPDGVTLVAVCFFS